MTQTTPTFLAPQNVLVGTYRNYEIKVNTWLLDKPCFYVTAVGSAYEYLNKEGQLQRTAAYFPTIGKCMKAIDKKEQA